MPASVGIDEELYVYGYEEDEEDEWEGRLLLDCGNPDCLMPGYHYLTECHTVEDMESLHASNNID